MLDKQIHARIIEIFFVILFVFASIPLWHVFERKLSNANITTLEDLKLTFEINNTKDYDALIVNNEYYVNKNYQIYLKTSNQIVIAKSSLIINNKTYPLKDFDVKLEGKDYVFTIVNNYIAGQKEVFNIQPILVGDDPYYTYVFHENNIF